MGSQDNMTSVKLFVAAIVIIGIVIISILPS